MSENNPENQENRQLSPLKAEENEKICWSPRFEFDAPRYTNFSSIKFRETRRLLNKLVLNQEDPEEDEEKEEAREEAENVKNENISMVLDDESDSEAFEDLISFTLRQDSDSSDIDEWFSRFHPLHEPLRPMTPPGPLISPEKLFVFKPQQSLKASPLKLNTSSGGASPKTLTALNLELNTPSKGPNTRIGLRSKPARVLKSNNVNSSFDSSPSSLVRSNFSAANNPLSSPTRTNRDSKISSHSNAASSPVRTNTNMLSSPVRTNTNLANSPVRTNTNLANSPVRMNTNLVNSPLRTNQNFLMPSPLKQNQQTMTPSRLSTASNASSITLSVSSLTKTFYNEPMPPRLSSPSRHTGYNTDFSKPAPPNSPLQMKTKFSEGISSPLRKAVGVLQLEEEPTVNINNNLKKRITDETTAISKKHRPAVKIDEELEDIKKLLSQHNNRIRPSHGNSKNKKKS